MTVTAQPTVGQLLFSEKEGVGIIAELTGDPPEWATVEFDSGTRKRIALNLQSIRTVDPDGFKVASSRRPQTIASDINERPAEVVRMILLDEASHTLDTESIRTQLVPRWVPEENWKKWWTKTKDSLRDDSRFDTTHSRERIYSLQSESRQRQDELLGRLGFAAGTNKHRLRDITELLEGHATSPLSEYVLESVRSQLDWMAKQDAADPWLQVEANILLQQKGWLDQTQFVERFCVLSKKPIRWRAVTNAVHFKIAQNALLDRVPTGSELPPAVWSGLLGTSRHSEWLLVELLNRFEPDSVTTGISRAFALAFPPESVLEAECSWILDLLEVVEVLRSAWQTFEMAAKLDWLTLSGTLKDCLLSLSSSDVRKKGVVETSQHLVRMIIRWYATDDPSVGVQWLARELTQPGRPVMVLPTFIETVIQDGYTGALLSHALTASESTVLNLIKLIAENAAPIEKPEELVVFFDDVVMGRHDDFSGLPALAEVILTNSEALITRIPDRCIPQLLRIVQAVSSSPSLQPRAVVLEQVVWHKYFLSLGSGGTSIPSEKLRIDPAFSAALVAYIRERDIQNQLGMEHLERELAATVEEVDALHQALTLSEARLEVLRRSREKAVHMQPAVPRVDEFAVSLLSLIAEIDRVAVRQRLRPEATAQLLQGRLQRLLRQAGLSQIGLVGERTTFAPGLHEIVEGTLGPQREVEVVEIGYRMHSEQNASLLLKAALVAATGA